MNKWQIICPVATMLLLALTGAILRVHKDSIGADAVLAYKIGHELTATTNSTRLAYATPVIQGRLADFLARPAHVESVVRGDAASPNGDGTATLRLYLADDAGDRLIVQLKPDPQIQGFFVLGLYTVHPRRAPATQ